MPKACCVCWGNCCWTCCNCCVHHGQPWRDVSGNLYHIGATALPITALVGFMIGIVLAYLMSRQLRQFGADTFIVNILGIALIRELGPMLAAILIAGRHHRTDWCDAGD